MRLSQLQSLTQSLINDLGADAPIAILFCLARDVHGIDPSVDAEQALDMLTCDQELEELQFRKLEAICSHLKADLDLEKG